VSQIFPNGDRVYFAAAYGLFYRDRSTGEIALEPGLGLLRIEGIDRYDDRSIIIDRQNTYFFDEHKLVPGTWFGSLQAGVGRTAFLTRNGIALFLRNDSLWIKKPDHTVVHNEFAALGFSSDLRIDSPFLWNRDQNYFYRYNAVTGEQRRYWYRLPATVPHSPYFHYDRDYIWIWRPGQVVVLSQRDGTHYSFPFAADNKFVSLHFDAENVYLLYRNKVAAYGKKEFVKACQVLDPGAYEREKQAYSRTVDSLGFWRDTVLNSVLAKYNYLRSRYAAATHPEIRQNLAYLETAAFSALRVYYPEQLEANYRDVRLPQPYRLLCLRQLLETAVRQLEFDRARQYESWMVGEALPEETRRALDANLAELHRYHFVIDSLDQRSLAPDSLVYFKAVALYRLCASSWFAGEGCYDFTVANHAMEDFYRKFPASQLRDNADYDIVGHTDCWEGGADESQLLDYIAQLRRLLRTYPESDLRGEFLAGILGCYLELPSPDTAATRQAAVMLLREFPEHPMVREWQAR
jgi:hypothetical protein